MWITTTKPLRGWLISFNIYTQCCTLLTKKCTHDSWFVLSCCSCLLTYFTQTLQGYFTGTGAIIRVLAKLRLLNKMQCTPDISISNDSANTPHRSPVRASYGVYFMNSYSERVSFLLFILCSLSRYIRCNRMFCFATVDRGSIMARMHRWSVMIYGSLQAEFMETNYNSHIHRYGTSIFGKIVVDISKSINNNNQIFWRL